MNWSIVEVEYEPMVTPAAFPSSFAEPFRSWLEFLQTSHQRVCSLRACLHLNGRVKLFNSSGSRIRMLWVFVCFVRIFCVLAFVYLGFYFFNLITT